MNAPGAVAQDLPDQSLVPELPGTDAPEEEPLPRYQVEVIVFAHSDADANEEDFDHALTSADAIVAAGTVQLVEPIKVGDVIAIDTFGDTYELAPDGRLRPFGTVPIEEPPIDIDEIANEDSVDPIEVPLLENVAEEALLAADPFEFFDPFGTLEANATDDLEQSGVEPFSFQLLSPEELELDGALATLERLGAYRVLGHAGWIQDGLDETNAYALDVSYLGMTNPRGSIRLYLGRFLHIALDLEYQAPSTAGNLGPLGFGLDEIELGRRYRLEIERNAMRSGELHYIDHPMFGVLVLVNPAPEPEEVPYDDTSVLSPAA